LLIAGMFSFMNAGSGSNQSNHAYKTGPIHFGITDRGLKLASDSYVFWPAHIGAITFISGRHYTHPVITDFPFSYLIEKKEQSYLLPGVSFISIGTARDEQKWPQRDRRRGKKFDFIRYELLNPYIVGNIQKGLAVLKNPSSVFTDVFIVPAARQRGIKVYELAEALFLLGALVKRVKKCTDFSTANLQKLVAVNATDGIGEWTDIAGLPCPETVLDSLLADIENGVVNQLADIAAAFENVYNAYSDYEWSWVVAAFEKKFGKRPEQLSAEEIHKYVQTHGEYHRQHIELLRKNKEKELKPYEKFAAKKT
jgi:hypothetical protein